MSLNDNIALVAGIAVAGIAAILLAIILVRKRLGNRDEKVPIPDEFEAMEQHAPALPPAANENAGKASSLLAIALVPARLRIEAGQAHVDYRLALDNCADDPLVSLRAHIELVVVHGETDPERLAARVGGPVAHEAPIRVAQLDPGATHQETGSLTVTIEDGDGPAVAIVRLRVLAANLAPITSTWVIGKARHQPGARIAAIVPIDLSRGPGIHELLLARQIG